MTGREVEKEASMADLVTIDIRDHVADVRLNRPDKMNAVNHDMWVAIGEAGNARSIPTE